MKFAGSLDTLTGLACYFRDPITHIVIHRRRIRSSVIHMLKIQHKLWHDSLHFIDRIREINAEI